jgi:hypothetical protein
MMNWLVRNTSTHVHVVPMDDLREHYLTQDCACAPQTDDDPRVIVHNSYDQREKSEPDYNPRKN